MFAKGEDERFYEIVNRSDLVFERTLSTQSVIEFENFVGRTYHKFVFLKLFVFSFLTMRTSYKLYHSHMLDIGQMIPNSIVFDRFNRSAS